MMCLSLQWDVTHRHNTRSTNQGANMTGKKISTRAQLQELQVSRPELHHHTTAQRTHPRPTADMIIRLGRLTPGYFRLLQRQVAGEVQTQPHDRAVNQIAMMLAIMGLSLSYYSAKRMTEKVQRLQKRRDSHTP
ncbi:hypothetical protein J4Q44_G00017930 [Coregonus suidteri]|uniref:Uncharacterized protein n=1 Tax=Coregonus suidteri TaxID=861788 RepID=A0AAN8R6R9_9TELE